MGRDIHSLIGPRYRCAYCGNVFEGNDSDKDHEGFDICPKCGNWELNVVAMCAHCGKVFPPRAVWGDSGNERCYCEDCLDEAIADPEWVSLFLSDRSLYHDFAEFCAAKELERREPF